MSDPSVRQPALTFRSVIGRFKLVGVEYVSYKDGSGFFVIPRANRPQPFPFAPSLRVYVAKHERDDIIPGIVVENWLSQLEVTPDIADTFWAVQDLQSGTSETGISAT
jgi:hypothetical protein